MEINLHVLPLLHRAESAHDKQQHKLEKGIPIQQHSEKGLALSAMYNMQHNVHMRFSFLIPFLQSLFCHTASL